MNQYRILRATNEIDLSTEVNRLINSGWEVKGGIAALNVLGVVFYYQSMFKAGQGQKEEKIKNNPKS